MLFRDILNATPSLTISIIALSLALLSIPFLIIHLYAGQLGRKEDREKVSLTITLMGIFFFVVSFASFLEYNSIVEQNMQSMLSNTQQKYDIEALELPHNDPYSWEGKRDATVVIDGEEHVFEFSVDTETWEPFLEDKTPVIPTVKVEEIAK